MAEVKKAHKPKILVPYGGPDPRPEILDVFMYLRPESNGVAVESRILKLIRDCRQDNADIELVYMANIPGEDMIRRQVVEHHYAVRLYFAVHGGSVFSPEMRRQFSDFYGESFDGQKVIGAFDALRRFGWQPEELFALWVEERAVVRIAGQVVKKYGDLWIVNYDIPALLHKNNAGTDIAVMTFRTSMGYNYFFELAARMQAELVKGSLLRRGMPIARAVHMSRSPFEQLLDSRDYLLDRDGSRLGVEASSFGAFLAGRGLSGAQIRGLVEHPICRFNFDPSVPDLHSLLDLCEGFSYIDGWNILSRITTQLSIPPPWQRSFSLPPLRDTMG